MLMGSTSTAEWKRNGDDTKHSMHDMQRHASLHKAMRESVCSQTLIPRNTGRYGVAAVHHLHKQACGDRATTTGRNDSFRARTAAAT